MTYKTIYNILLPLISRSYMIGVFLTLEVISPETRIEASHSKIVVIFFVYIFFLLIRPGYRCSRFWLRSGLTYYFELAFGLHLIKLSLYLIYIKGMFGSPRWHLFKAPEFLSTPFAPTYVLGWSTNKLYSTYLHACL